MWCALLDVTSTWLVHGPLLCFLRCFFLHYDPPLLMTAVDSLFQPVAEAAGVPLDYVKLFTCLLAAFPLSAGFAYLPTPTQRHVYSLMVSFLFFVPMLNLYSGFVQLVGSALLTYFICLYRVGGKQMGRLVFGLQMGHLTLNHAVRKIGGIPLSTIEITAMQMVAVMNLTTFAWDCYDGQHRSAEQCDEGQKKTRITQMPSLLEFLGYVFYFPGVLIGPATKFCDYKAWSDGSLYATPKGKEKAKEAGVAARMPAGRVLAALLDLSAGLGFMAVYSLYASGYSYERLIDGGLRGYTWYQTILFVQVAGLMARTKYYGVWSVTNAACILSGLGYNGTDPRTGRTRWNRCRNIDIPKIEFANNWKELLDHWNMNTNVWLRNNVYKRIARPGKKPGFKSTMTTFFTSAFWHGLEPGYYLSFILAGFMQSAAKMLRRHVRPVFFPQPNVANPSFSNLLTYTPSQLAYCTLSVVVSQMTLNYAVAPFMLLGFRESIQGWKSAYFYGHILTLIAILAFQNGLGKALDKRSGRVPRKAGAGSTTTTDNESDAEPLRATQLKQQAKQVTTLTPEPIS